MAPWRRQRVFSLMPSTVIKRFDYEPGRKELLVTFTTGRRYIYSKVPPKAVERFRRATSKGRYFNAHIRDRYAYRELEPAWGGDD